MRANVVAHVNFLFTIGADFHVRHGNGRLRTDRFFRSVCCRRFGKRIGISQNIHDRTIGNDRLMQYGNTHRRFAHGATSGFARIRLLCSQVMSVRTSQLYWHDHSPFRHGAETRISLHILGAVERSRQPKSGKNDRPEERRSYRQRFVFPKQDLSTLSGFRVAATDAMKMSTGFGRNKVWSEKPNSLKSLRPSSSNDTFFVRKKKRTHEIFYLFPAPSFLAACSTITLYLSNVEF